MKIVALILSLFLLSANAAHAQISDLDDAVYKAAKLGMLSQRAAKAYIAGAMNVDDVQTKRILSESVAQFDRTLIEIKVFAPTPEIKATMDQMETKWRGLKDTLVGKPPTVTTARVIMSAEIGLLELSSKAAKSLQALSKKPVTKLIELAENDAMLTQRVALYYFAALLDIEPARANREVERASREYVNNSQMLKEAKETPTAIRRKLELVESQWAFVDSALKSRGDARNRSGLAKNMLRSSERILLLLDEIALDFERL